MPLVDSKRLAAFRLGYHGRLLQSIIGKGIEGDIFTLQDVHGCSRKIDEAIFVLAECLSAAEYSEFSHLLLHVRELHDVVCAIGPPEATIPERRAIEKLERDDLERIEFLSRRAVKKDSALDAWYHVGHALADFKHKVVYTYDTANIPEKDWDILNEAVDQLPEIEKRVAEPFIFGMSYGDLTSLAVEIVQVYDDICQCLSSPDQPHGVQVETLTSAQFLINDTTGLIHTSDYSICKSKDRIYNLSSISRALVHSLNEWRREGVEQVSKLDIIQRAVLIYQDDPNMTRAIENVWDRKIHSILEDSKAWNTLVKSTKDRKALYYIDL